MNYKTFYKSITEDNDILNKDDLEYATYHCRRLYDTYKRCKQHLKEGDHVLSIGANFASIEKVLVQNDNITVTVVDFPEVIEEYKPIFERYGINYISKDLTKGDLGLPEEGFDMLLQSEVIEHLPVAPSDQINKFSRYIRKGGLFTITTPNLGSSMHLIFLLLMKPIFVKPELMFGPVNKENQGVHRREYLPVEIADAFSDTGYTLVHKSFFFYTYPKSLPMKIIYSFGHLVPRFRPGMTLIGKKS